MVVTLCRKLLACMVGSNGTSGSTAQETRTTSNAHQSNVNMPNSSFFGNVQVMHLVELHAAETACASQLVKGIAIVTFMVFK